MLFYLISEDPFVELGILCEKAEAALYSAVDEPLCARAQSLIYIACDYLSGIRETTQAMQESRVKVPNE